ncbi:MAG: hypothetical protein RLN62_04225 [Rickettsiales bacterium]
MEAPDRPFLEEMLRGFITARLGIPNSHGGAVAGGGVPLDCDFSSVGGALLCLVTLLGEFHDEYGYEL